ncbi:SCO7613 C-terminal domain-containing membrane protein [Streptomyces sp. NPDC006879]|uniref:SCO7613 C-terminal domain-containing membrane protein n=1 Tax=Streptomyces sp. NPDC006879 TaxID=3364767 RepID=UPI0036C4AA43
MENPLPPAEELRLIDRELAQLDARRVQLLNRRAWLLSVLAPRRPLTGPPARHPAAPSGPGGRPGPSAQSVLLALGAVLLGVAALAFTLLSWGSMGIGGRASVLATVTVGALTAPAVLLRHGLRSTAESVVALGLALTILDAYALHEVALPDLSGLGYAAGCAAVLCVLWAGYGLRLPQLRLPAPCALLAAQLPLPLAALTTNTRLQSVVWAALLTAAADAGWALRPGGRRILRDLAGIAAWVLGAMGLAAALALMLSARSLGSALLAAAPLAAGAWLGLWAALRVAARAAGARTPVWAAALAAAAGLSLISATSGVLRLGASGQWSTLITVLAAGVLAGAVASTGSRMPPQLRQGLWVASGLVCAGATVAALPLVALALLGPLGGLGSIWSGPPPAYADLLPGTLPAALVLLVSAGTLAAAHRRAVHPAAGAGALLLAWSGLFSLPMAAGWPYPVALAAQLSLTGATALAAVAATGRAARPAPGAATQSPTASGTARLATVAALCAGLGAASSSMLALTSQAATFAAFGFLGAACVAVAVRGAGGGHGLAARLLSGSGAAGAVGYTAGLVLAAAWSLGVPAQWLGVVLLSVPAGSVAVAAGSGPVRRVPSPLRVPLEVAGALVGLVALGLGLVQGDAPLLALTLGLAAVICAASALRVDRRAVGYAAVALFVLASWVRLAAYGVEVPEAYALPVSLPALAVGLARRRRDPESSSWSAYGPGLAATLLPGLVAAWVDPHWLRPLLLGLTALGVTLVGARYRLQAPLLLGGLTLAGVALHELAPYVVQVVDALPRWLPPALAGLLLLTVGATYERRLGDARRLRNSLGRLR